MGTTEKHDHELFAQPLYSRCSTKNFAPSLKIFPALSAVAFELDSPERESGESSTTPWGVKGVVGPSSCAQIRLAAEKTEYPLQRTTGLLPCSLSGHALELPLNALK